MLLYVIVRESNSGAKPFKRFSYRTSIVTQGFTPKASRVLAKKFSYGMMLKLKVSIPIGIT
jgi:hypothetical protein